jgi:hypothetical protein
LMSILLQQCGEGKEFTIQINNNQTSASLYI